MNEYDDYVNSGFVYDSKLTRPTYDDGSHSPFFAFNYDAMGRPTLGTIEMSAHRTNMPYDGLPAADEPTFMDTPMPNLGSPTLLEAAGTPATTESNLSLGCAAEAEYRGEIKRARRDLLQVLDFRFPGTISRDIRELIQKQDSLYILEDWFKAALQAFSIDSFRGQVLR
jgi:hypothetical protein